MMGAITLAGVLRAEHDVLHDALTEWCGMVKERANEDLQYVFGVHDMAHRLITELEGKDGENEK